MSPIDARRPASAVTALPAPWPQSLRLLVLMLAMLTLLALAPRGAAAGPRFMFIPLGAADGIAVVEAETAVLLAQFGPVEAAHGLAVTPDGRSLYAASVRERPVQAASARPRTQSFVSHIDAQNGRLLRRIDVQRSTHHITVTPDGRWAVAVQAGAGRVAVIYTASDTLVRFVPVGERPNFAVAARDGRRLFVSNAGADSLTVLEPDTWRVLGTVAVGAGPEHMALSPDGHLLYVVNTGADSLSVVDVERLREVRRVRTGAAPHGLTILGASGQVVVANRGADSLSVLSAAGDPVRMVSVGPQPYHVAAVGAATELWVTSRTQERVWQLTGRELTLARTVMLPGIGYQVASVP